MLNVNKARMCLSLSEVSSIFIFLQNWVKEPHPAVSAALTVLVMRAARETQHSLMWKLIYSPGFSPEMFTLRHNTPPWVAACQVS